MDLNILMNKFSSESMLNRNVLISEIILLLYGIFLLVLPAKALHLSVGFIGIVMIIAGVGCLVWFFLHREGGNYPMIALGAIGIAVGIIVLVFRSAVAMVLFPIMLGLWTLFSTVLAGFAAYGNYRLGTGMWWIPLLAAIVGAVVTVMIFMNLSGTERFMARILGIYFITYNIVRIGEFAVTYLAPAPAPKKKPVHKKTGAAPRKKVYEEEYDRPRRRKVEEEYDRPRRRREEEEYDRPRRPRREYEGERGYGYDFERDNNK